MKWYPQRPIKYMRHNIWGMLTFNQVERAPREFMSYKGSCDVGCLMCEETSFTFAGLSSKSARSLTQVSPSDLPAPMSQALCTNKAFIWLLQAPIWLQVVLCRAVCVLAWAVGVAVKEGD